MSTREKNKTSRNPNEDVPSFSSALLEQIYRSIDCSEDSKPQPTAKSTLHRPTVVAEDELETRSYLAEKTAPKPTPNSDNLFFFASSSNVEFSTRPKPIRTGASARQTTEDYDPTESKSKSKAMMRLHADLKKSRHPISPGGRLTGFISSLFSNANGKKSKNDKEIVDRSVSLNSRSRMCKYSSGSRESARTGTAQRTVKLNTVIVGLESRACVHKSVSNEERGKYVKKPPLAGNASRRRDSKRLDDFATTVAGDDEVDDGGSDASSDLFELNHSTMFGNNNRLCEELPVYEKTYILRNKSCCTDN